MQLKKLLLLLIVVSPVLGFARIIKVNHVADNDFPGHLRHASKTEATDGDTILIDVKGNIELDSSITFPAVNDLLIIGPYPKHLSIVPATGFTGPALFLIQNREGISIRRMAFVGGDNPALIVNNNVNFEVVHCLFENIVTTTDGAAIQASDSDMEVFGCSFIDCAANNGGAISLSLGNTKIFNSTFVNNSAANNGGAIYAKNSAAVDLVHNTFSENEAATFGEVITAASTSSVQLQNNAGAGNGTGDQFVDLLGSVFTSFGGNVFITAAAEVIPFSGTDILNTSVTSGLRTSLLEDGYGLKYYPIRDPGSDFRNNGVDGGLAAGMTNDGRRAPRELEGTKDAGACEYTELIVTNTFIGVGDVNSFIWAANNATDPINYIEFDIPGQGVHTISNTSSVFIDQRVGIDGYTQPGSEVPGPAEDGFTGVTPAIIDIQIENSSGPSLTLGTGSNDSEVAGLRFINASASGIEYSAPGTEIYGNVFGIDATGSVAPCTHEGISSYSGNGIIGGLEHAKRNVISGNGTTANECQIYLESSGNQILGNFIGLTEDGLSNFVATTADGIKMDATVSNFIGRKGASIGQNIISGNHIGILMIDASNTQVSNNIIGLDYEGINPVANDIGVEVTSGNDNYIGGISFLYQANAISANDTYGIHLTDGLDGVYVRGNLIGMGVDSLTVLGNGIAGIRASDADNVNIGGSVPFRNTIVGSTDGDDAGILLENSGNGTNISANYIGLDPSGASSAPNFFGIHIKDDHNSNIGGPPGQENYISGNLDAGIMVESANVIIDGNFIGVSADATPAILGNKRGISAVVKVEIGSTGTRNNVISGNTEHGIYLDTPGANTSSIDNCFIGTDLSASLNLGNTVNGINIEGANSVTIGLLHPNVIAANGEQGIKLSNADNCQILQSVIGSNTAAGIGNGQNGILLTNSSKYNIIGQPLNPTNQFNFCKFKLPNLII
ncbi:MAG: hypothetical protein MK078_11640 [Crocinitomicaceae bacterium]|nr:hypothetical protein [Crocinitomicaceae bacterium]